MLFKLEGNFRNLGLVIKMEVTEELFTWLQEANIVENGVLKSGMR
jgi:hypothetical protein